MKFFGYSNEMINGVEQDMLMAELDQKDRTFIRFCRSLARSNPRPPKSDRDKLLKLGFSPVEVSEMAFHIARECFVNRVVTFISSPPMSEFERLSGSLWGWILRPLIARKLRTSGFRPEGPLQVKDGPFVQVVRALKEIPAAVIFQDGIEGAFKSKMLSDELKVLMFAVVARSLGCSACHDATCTMAYDLGFTEEDFSQSLSTLSSPRLNEHENMILSWTRETIHYQPAPMQSSTKILAETVGQEILLEAIGVAALANSIVRLAILLE
jgi:alkylhydroperoxidase family enzyme